MSQATLAALSRAVRDSFKEAVGVSTRLYKIMLPLLVAVKILTEFDLLKYVAMPLEPVMSLLYLPADLAIVCAAGMVVNIYLALILLASMLSTLEPLTAAQISTIALMILFAHSLPVEVKVAHECGVSLIGHLSLRLGVSFGMGILFSSACHILGLLTGPATMVFQGGDMNPDLMHWILNEVMNCAGIYLIISGLLLMQRGIEHFHITRWIALILKPLLKLLGLSAKAATTVMVGLTMGLVYGSGLILKASHDGTLSKKDIFGSITLIGLAHAIIEDSLLMIMAGANTLVVLIFRPLVGILIGALVVKLRWKFGPDTGAGDA